MDGPVSNFVHHHPTPKTLALAPFVLIGIPLTAERMNPQSLLGYISSAAAFSLVVEVLNLR